jgi:hypothetical protein
MHLYFRFRERRLLSMSVHCFTRFPTLSLTFSANHLLISLSLSFTFSFTPRLSLALIYISLSLPVLGDSDPMVSSSVTSINESFFFCVCNICSEPGSGTSIHESLFGEESLFHDVWPCRYETAICLTSKASLMELTVEVPCF